MRIPLLLALGILAVALLDCGGEVPSAPVGEVESAMDLPCPSDGLSCTDDVRDGNGKCIHVSTCNDGVGCTLDTCTKSGCVFEPHDESCAVPGECRTGVCGTPKPGPGQRVVPGFVSGCSLLLDDGWCKDEWDGCACNGAETCQPTGGHPVSGCASPTPASWPCEGILGDGDGCTVENCCEPWDPVGCRLHRDAAASNPVPGEDPPLKKFCDAAEKWLTEPTATPLGTVQCAQDPVRYSIPAVDPILGGPIACDAPPGFFCNDCNPCTKDTCDSPSGTCINDPYPDGDVIEEHVPAPGCDTIVDAVYGCASPEDDFCNGVASHGCASRACYSGTCSNGPNTKNADPAKSDGCHGFPGVAEDDTDIPAWGAAARSCADLSCTDLGSPGMPDWRCVAHGHDDVCDDGAFCNGPGACSFDAICDGCSPSEVADILLSAGGVLDDTPPAPGALIHGCVQQTAAEVCDDGVGCTVDGCVESEKLCVHDASNLICAGTPDLKDWDACAATSVCDAVDGCIASDPDQNACGKPIDCTSPLECTPVKGGRLCSPLPGSCKTTVCEQQAYTTVSLTGIHDLCPFHPPGQVPEGDREFSGHGPRVRLSVQLELAPVPGSPYTAINAVVHFEARESAPDYSTLVWTSAPVQVGLVFGTVDHIVSNAEGHAFGVSNPGGTVGQACGNCGVVEWSTLDGVIADAKVRGDTPDGDISDDTNCNEDTWIEQIDLAPIQVFVRSPCVD